MTALAYTRPVGDDADGERRIKLLHLLALDESHRLGMPPCEAETAAMTRWWRRQFALESLADFAAWLNGAGLDLPRFRTAMIELAALERILRRRREAVERELVVERALASVAAFRTGRREPAPLSNPAAAEKVALTRLLAREEVLRAGLEPDDGQLQARERQWRRQQGLTEARLFARWLAFAGINPGRLRRAVADLAAVEILLVALAPAIETRLPDFRALHSVRGLATSGRAA